MINLLRQLCTKLWQLRMKTLAFQRNYLASEDAQLRKAPPRLRRESIPPRRLMLTVLGGLAEFERELILARTDDGRKRAKARGVKFGR
jgi:hypothetical protein